MTQTAFAWPSSVFVFVNAFCMSMISTTTGSTIYGRKGVAVELETCLSALYWRTEGGTARGLWRAPAYSEEGDPRWRAWWDAMPREDLRLIAETVKRFLDSSGDRSVIGDRESLMGAVERVKAHSDLRPDRIDRREINRRLQQYACGDRGWLFCDRIG
jgi:hypothetical protein